MLMPVALAMSWWGWHSADPAAMVSKRVSSCIPHLFFFLRQPDPETYFQFISLKNFKNLFLTVLGLCSCAQAFSSYFE